MSDELEAFYIGRKGALKRGKKEERLKERQVYYQLLEINNKIKELKGEEIPKVKLTKTIPSYII